MKAEQILRFHLSWVTGPLLALVFTYIFGNLLAALIPGGLHRIPNFVPVFHVLLFSGTTWYLIETLGRTRLRLMVERGPMLTVITLSAWLAYQLKLSITNPLVISCGAVVLIWVVLLSWCGFKYRRAQKMQMVKRRIA